MIQKKTSFDKLSSKNMSKTTLKRNFDKFKRCTNHNIDIHAASMKYILQNRYKFYLRKFLDSLYRASYKVSYTSL